MNTNIKNMFKQLNIHSTYLWCFERQRPYIESQVLMGTGPVGDLSPRSEAKDPTRSDSRKAPVEKK